MVPTSSPDDHERAAYRRTGEQIYRESFRIIRAETDLSRLPRDLQAVAVRMVHACGMVDVVDDVDCGGDVGRYARAALLAGAPVLVDAMMVLHGITRSRLPADNKVMCMLDEPDIAQRAARNATTRSAAALDYWSPHLHGAVVAIGNAPTALFRLLEMIDEGAPRPAAIIGMPVGFVGAAESKELLATGAHGVPWLTVHGRRGGSALAAAAINALASERE